MLKILTDRKSTQGELVALIESSDYGVIEKYKYTVVTVQHSNGSYGYYHEEELQEV